MCCAGVSCEIRETIGIDETLGHAVDNNSYVNIGAIATLRLGARLALEMNRPRDADRCNEDRPRGFVPMKGAVILNHDQCSAA